ncbi:MAG: hypothetical protein RIS09_391 [Actinomycetota bacterium]|jgi:hypothetical protein
MRAIEEYREQRQELISENAVIRLLAQIEQRQTYQQLLEFKTDIEGSTASSPWHLAEKFWLDKLEAKLSYMPPNMRDDFQLVEHSEIFRRFSSSQDRPRKLLVCFSGMFGGLMIPTWAFLAHLPPAVTDVLVIDSRRRFGTAFYQRFQSEWQNINQKFMELQQDLHPVANYIYGVSGGATPAVLFACNHQIEKMMLVAAAAISDRNFTNIDPNFDFSKYTRSTTSQTSVLYVFGLRDYIALRQVPTFLRKFSQRKLLLDFKSGHDVITRFYRTKRLEGVLKWFE